jgi:hypothetical protein
LILVTAKPLPSVPLMQFPEARNSIGRPCDRLGAGL